MGWHGGEEAENGNYGIVKNVESQVEFSIKWESIPVLRCACPKHEAVFAFSSMCPHM